MMKLLKYLLIAAFGLTLLAAGTGDTPKKPKNILQAHKEYSSQQLSLLKMDGEIYQSCNSYSSNNTLRVSKKNKRAGHSDKEYSESLRHQKYICRESNYTHIYKSSIQGPYLAISANKCISLGKLII